MSSASRRRPGALLRISALAVGAALALGTSIVTAGSAHADEVYNRPANGVLSLAGHGWGHGHGLSQYGAYGAAQAGLTWDKIIGFYYNGYPVVSMGNPTIRVSVPSASGSASTAAVKAADGLTATFGDTTIKAVTLPAKNYQGVAITDWAVYGATSQQAVLKYHLATGEWVGPYRTDKTGRINLSNPKTGWVDAGRGVYRGTLSGIVTSSSSTSVTSVLALSMDNYLRRVVPSESPAYWPGAALQAQAVAARSYAGYYVNHPRSSYYNICGTDACQVFGASAEQQSTDAAVSSTSGKVVSDGTGKPAFTEFSSSNGGWAADGGKPWAVAHADKYDGAATTSTGARANPYFLWSKDIKVSTIEAAWPSIGSFQRLRITQRDTHGDWGGRVLQATLEGSTGSVDVTGGTLRSALGLRSEWFVPVNVVSDPSFPRDVTADGRPDVVAVQASSGALLAYPGTGSGGFLPTRTLAPSGWGGYTKVLTAGAWTGHSLSDLMATTKDGTLWLVSVGQTGTVSSPQRIGTGWGGMDTIFTPGDFDADGHADLIARRHSDQALFLYRGNGSGGFLGARQIGWHWGAFTALVSPGDFTGDGRSDILARRPDGKLALYAGNGTGGLSAGKVIGWNWNGITAMTSPGDFSGDGKADLIARTTTGALVLYLGDGKGGWSGSRQIGTGWNGLSTIAP